jgi:dTDP-4-dehydrorhamnose reductase
VESALAACGTLVVRTHAYGWSAANEGSFLDSMWRRLAAQEQPSCDGRHYVTPILASDLAPLLARAYELKLHGLYHITGAERTNRIRFANELAAAGGYEGDYRSPMPQSEMNTGPALETSLNTRRARRDLELTMPLLREGLERLMAQRVSGYLDRLQPSKKAAASHAA